MSNHLRFLPNVRSPYNVIDRKSNMALLPSTELAGAICGRGALCLTAKDAEVFAEVAERKAFSYYCPLILKGIKKLIAKRSVA